ncbi:ATP-binding cassette domain-containing protein [Streptococcus panodentis]|uniref:ABC transporter ATP-binding protein n=1 Tax=Streptococcus panodentis TaxID=1581472 RepID=A0ABS5AYX8_9STRE|nr:ABC transporter ATP-binding protein [Streptococcus panodentis]MBP2621453.1 hypothetical protein [Streptococcus panodentis]
MKKYFYQNPFLVGQFLIVNIIGAISVLSLAFVLEGIIDSISNVNSETFIFYVVLLLVYIVFDSLMEYCVEVSNQKLIQKILHDIRSDLTDSNGGKSLLAIYRSNPEMYISTYTNELEVLEKQYLEQIISITNDILVFVFASIISLFLQPSYTIIMVILSLLPLFYPLLTQNSLQKARDVSVKSKENYFNVVSDFYFGLKTVKLFEAVHSFTDIVNSKSKQLRKSNVAYYRKANSIEAISYAITMIVNQGAWVVGGFFVLKGRLSLGEFIGLRQLVMYITYPITNMKHSYTDILSSKKLVNDLVKTIKQVPAEASNRENIKIDTIELVNFGILGEKQNILQNINLTFEIGKKYLIVGKSGSGKSTLLNSLIGLIPDGFNTTGSILVNGQDFTSIKLDYSSVAYVEQKTFIFDKPAIDNLTMYKDYDKGLLHQVLQKVSLETINLEDEIKNKLSGGQERRLDFARSLLANKEILLLDEVTSSLDKENRLRIEELVASLQGKMIICIAHEPSDNFISMFDEVLTLEEGMIKSNS